jgi:DNA-binding response OmpR family regulator
MGKKVNILVVDDEESIRELIKLILETEGLAVTLTANGDSALALLEQIKFDLVLLDIRMPGLDGYQVLERIRKTSNVQVLMLTGVIEVPAATLSLDLGADDYIQKPFLRSELIAHVEAKLRRSKVLGEAKRI